MVPDRDNHMRPMEWH